MIRFLHWLRACTAASLSLLWLSSARAVTPLPPQGKVGQDKTFLLLERLVVPYFIGIEEHHGGLRAGWEFGSYRFSAPGRPTLGIGAGLLLSRYRGFEHRNVYGPTATLAAVALDRELGLRTFWHLGGGDEGWRAVGVEAFVRPLSLLELYVGVHQIGCLGRWDCRSQLVGGIGLSDFNGLAYWLTHVFAGTDRPYENLVAAGQ
jgi:hypothetical protein